MKIRLPGHLFLILEITVKILMLIHQTINLVSLDCLVLEAITSLWSPLCLEGLWSVVCGFTLDCPISEVILSNIISSLNSLSVKEKKNYCSSCHSGYDVENDCFDWM